MTVVGTAFILRSVISALITYPPAKIHWKLLNRNQTMIDTTTNKNCKATISINEINSMWNAIFCLMANLMETITKNDLK